MGKIVDLDDRQRKRERQKGTVWNVVLCIAYSGLHSQHPKKNVTFQNMDEN